MDDFSEWDQIVALGILVRHVLFRENEAHLGILDRTGIKLFGGNEAVAHVFGLPPDEVVKLMTGSAAAAIGR